jgi:hypothetical protein
MKVVRFGDWLMSNSEFLQIGFDPASESFYLKQDFRKRSILSLVTGFFEQREHLVLHEARRKLHKSCVRYFTVYEDFLNYIRINTLSLEVEEEFLINEINLLYNTYNEAMLNSPYTGLEIEVNYLS